MAKWADFCISKLTMVDGMINNIIVCPDNGEGLGKMTEQNRLWMLHQITYGKTFCTIRKNKEGSWNKLKNVNYNGSIFSWEIPIPENLPNRKTFVSFYHKDDQGKREEFGNLFDDLLTSKSVNDGDIDSGNNDAYIKKLIQQNYLQDTTVLIVLVGRKTKCRKHVDWEISAALNYKVGDKYSAVLGLLLPSHPNFGTGKYDSQSLPKRLAANIDSGYAILKDWTEDRAKMQSYIELAISKRSESDKIVNRTIQQMDSNLCS